MSEMPPAEIPDSNSDDVSAPPVEVSRGGTGLALLQLVRLPTVFTAMSDIFMGFLLTHGTYEPLRDFGLLLIVSVCHYWSGMILNDYFDRDVDARERAGRPIPSGRISARTALLLAVTLNGTGLAVAAMLGTNTLLIAGLLTLAVWLYDGTLKKTPLAPVLMGSCRFLNVLLGASLSPTGELWCLPQLHIAGALGLYICGVTLFARQEASISNRGKLIAAAFVINLGLAALMGFILQTPLHLDRNTPIAVLAVVTLTILRRLVRAMMDPSPQTVQTGVKLMLLSYVMLNATIVMSTTRDTLYPLSVIALLAPAVFLARRIPMT